MPTTPMEHRAGARPDRSSTHGLDGYRAERVSALQERRRQLEQQLERCRTAASNASETLRPSVGREIDDTRATLAIVRSELARLRR